MQTARHPPAERGGRVARARTASCWNSAALRTSVVAASRARSVAAARLSWRRGLRRCPSPAPQVARGSAFRVGGRNRGRGGGSSRRRRGARRCVIGRCSRRLVSLGCCRTPSKQTALASAPATRVPRLTSGRFPARPPQPAIVVTTDLARRTAVPTSPNPSSHGAAVPQRESAKRVHGWTQHATAETGSATSQPPTTGASRARLGWMTSSAMARRLTVKADVSLPPHRASYRPVIKGDHGGRFALIITRVQLSFLGVIQQCDGRRH